MLVIPIVFPFTLKFKYNHGNVSDLRGFRRGIKLYTGISKEITVYAFYLSKNHGNTNIDRKIYLKVHIIKNHKNHKIVGVLR